MVVRTRFAPSPTGFLHVGGVRTALFAWAYAKNKGGDFILRIEDTDNERSTKESVAVILDGMNWLGLNVDEGPYYQSERYPRYMEVIDSLLATNKAYVCSCTKERLDDLRERQLASKEKPRYDGKCRDKKLPQTDEPHVIRFKNPESGEVFFHDLVYGDITVQNKELDDFIILRTDKHPTYNFAVVVDDIDMQISHVIRGDDHINNTPRQINLYNALNAKVPEFAHLPMILGDDGKRLSKRHGAVSVLEFRREGILREALLNYLVRLGWSSGDKEIFSLAEIQQEFALKNVSRGTSSFNYEKLYWLNQHYIKTLPVDYVAKELKYQFELSGVDISNGPSLTDIVNTHKERAKTLKEMSEASHYFYRDVAYDEQAIKKHLRPVVLEPLTELYNKLAKLDTFTESAITTAINEVCETYQLNMGKIAQPLRVAVTGNSMSPSIDITLVLIGKERVLKRMQDALEIIKIRKDKA